MSQPPSRLLHGQRIYPVSAERMAAVQDGAVDVIVTSPPYNRGKCYSGDDRRAHDDRLSESAYLALLRRVFAECRRVLRDDGLFFLNIGDAAGDQGKSERVAQTAVQAGFRRIQTVAWVKSLLGKGHYTPSGRDRRLNNCWEAVFLLAKTERYRLDPKAIGIPYADKSNIGRYGETDLRDAGNVWLVTYSRTTGHTVKKGHDAPFPVELPYRCIKLVPGARLVLDPFGGTMSTLAAARALGLRGIGFEPFPRWSVIEACLAEGARFRPPPVQLIPELERGVAVLLELVRELGDGGTIEEVLARRRMRRDDRELVLRLAGAAAPPPPEARRPRRRHTETTPALPFEEH
ncbi:MAG: site-specific DNA-methyltransferase [Planctomycetes bacterium]|nr:site-specific DNA-methyltransferase [Planctomycetota bacterium]